VWRGVLWCQPLQQPRHTHQPPQHSPPEQQPLNTHPINSSVAAHLTTAQPRPPHTRHALPPPPSMSPPPAPTSPSTPPTTIVVFLHTHPRTIIPTPSLHSSMLFPHSCLSATAIHFIGHRQGFKVPQNPIPLKKGIGIHAIPFSPSMTVPLCKDVQIWCLCVCVCLSVCVGGSVFRDPSTHPVPAATTHTYTHRTRKRRPGMT